ncbi:MAG: lipase family protein [Thiobacillaceae bacterium]
MSDASAPPPGPDLNLAIQYAYLVKIAEAVPPNQTVYSPGDVINVTYGVINIDYTVVATVYGNDLATDVNPARAAQIVSFGFIAQDAAGNAVVSVRGTEGILEWLQDARFLAVKCPFLTGAGCTEDGFTAVYESLRVSPDPASSRVVEALPNLAFLRPMTSLTICGHSLGGALVTLCALDVAANTQFKHPVVYSYASPRTGDSSFADTYNQVVPNTFRFANRLDIVPKVPLRPPYEHVLGLQDLNPLLNVKLDILCEHHLTTYMHLISSLGGGTVLPLDADCKGL